VCLKKAKTTPAYASGANDGVYLMFRVKLFVKSFLKNLCENEFVKRKKVGGTTPES